MYKEPSFLKQNDKVAIIATAKNFDKKELAASITLLRSWGLAVVEGKNLYKKYNQFAGNDQERETDLQEMLDNPEIKAIFCARGGYGTARIIDNIVYKKFLKNPKWIIGFSDVTVLHAALQKLKMQSIHGIMPLLFGTKEYEASVQKLKEVLFGKKLFYTIASNPLNKTGNSSGILTGGNLSIINSLIGTDCEVKTKNKILLLEDVGENLYRVDRMMVQLKRAGVLKSLSGLIIGHFTAMEDNTVKFGKNAYEIIADAVKEYNYPVCYDFPAGHEPDNMPLILGAKVTLSVTKKTVLIGI